MTGGRLSLEETAHLTAWAHSLLDKILTDLALTHEALYGLQAPPESNGGGRPKGSHSEPAVRAGKGWTTPEGEYRDRWLEASAAAGMAAQWVKTAVSNLVLADEAAGLALLKTDPHRGLAEHVPAPYHDPATLRTGRPDLAAALDAQHRRRGRGEL